MATDFLINLNQRRGYPIKGHTSIWELETHGAVVIEPTAFEPDPLTHRNDYYYNAITNTLYQRIIITQDAFKSAYWKKVSE